MRLLAALAHAALLVGVGAYEWAARQPEPPPPPALPAPIAAEVGR